MVDVRMTPLGQGPKPICLQPLPRPSEQWGWVHEVTLGDDFDNRPYVKKFIFRHDGDSSRRVFWKFRGGADLFPPDPMSIVADKIMQARVVPLAVASKTIRDLIDDPLGLPDASVDDVLSLIATEKTVTVVDGPVSVVDAQRARDIETAWTRRRDTFLNGIGIRLVRTDPDAPAV